MIARFVMIIICDFTEPFYFDFHEYNCVQLSLHGV